MINLIFVFMLFSLLLIVISKKDSLVNLNNILFSQFVNQSQKMLKRAKEKGELIRGKISNSNSSSNNILYDDWDSLLKCPNWDSSELKRNRKELIRRRRIPPNIRGDVTFYTNFTL